MKSVSDFYKEQLEARKKAREHQRISERILDSEAKREMMQGEQYSYEEWGPAES